MKLKRLEFIGRRLRPVELRMFVKWICRLKREVVTLPNGLKYKIDPISDLGLSLLKDKAYEKEMTELIESILEKGDSFVDLGANEGFFTVLTSKITGNTGKVFSIEPQRRLWNVIYDNLFLNESNNVQLLPYGIGSSKQELILQLYPSTNSGATSFSNTFNFKISFSWIRKKIYGSQLSKVITLDELEDVFGSKIKLIKIDIEGFELEALKGAGQLLSKKIFTNLLIETHEQALKGMNQSLEMIDTLMEKNGYQKKVIAGNLNLYSLK